MNTTSNNDNNPLEAGDAPPPYSETDIYSTTSAPSRSPRSTSGIHSFPRPHSHSHSHGAEDAASRISSTSTTDPVIFTPPLTPRTNNASIANSNNVVIPPSPSAALYFDEHPISPTPSQPEPFVHSISVGARSIPDDVPYPNDWATRHQITPQDWATFVNFLLPDHDASSNEALLGEKAKTEDGASTSAKSEYAVSDPDEAMRRRAGAEATVRQWNDGFFGPRGITVRLEQPEQSVMPGAWNAEFDDQSRARAGASTQREVPQTQRRQSWRPSFGGFRADADGFRWGDSFVADSNGLRIGSLVMDNNGIRMNGRTCGNPRSQAASPVCSPGYGQQNHAATGSNPWDHRGRPTHHYGPGHRSHSRSSSSSSSSSSVSSTSSASIGSLPDYDDVRPQQLPVYVGRLEEWIAQSDQMRTRADIKQLQSEIKACKTSSLDPSYDRNELEARLRILTQQWRTLRKQQKRERRERRREAKRRRRAEKREKRRQKKDLRRARRDHRNGRGGPSGPPLVPQIHVPPINVPPVQVPQINVPPIQVPWFGMPPTVAGPSCSSWGRGNQGKGCHGPFGKGGFFGPQGPLGPNGPLGPGGFFGGRCAVPGPDNARHTGPTGPFPGAWPENESDESRLPSPGPESTAKYRAAAGLQTAIETKQADIATREISDSERRAVEKEMEALTEALEAVRVEADEAYARELARKR